MEHTRTVLHRFRYGVNPVPRIKKREQSGLTAKDIFVATDKTMLNNAIEAILSQGGAVMLGQTRDNEKLIVTVYLDGDNDKEYCEDARDVENFVGQYQV